MTKTLALLHTTPVTVTGLKEQAAALVPGARIINVLDDSLLPDVIAAGGVTDAVEARMNAYVAQAVAAGADVILCCCSSVGEAAERCRAHSPIPVLRIDEPMAEEAARLGSRIGVIATVSTTLAPTANLIRRKAVALGKTAEVEAVLVDGAFAALNAGRPEEHDALVLKALTELLQRSDVVVLAQASMARLISRLGEAPRAPILTSPEAGLKAAARALAAKE
jgi:Asp/Glu/hydantoin racemase